MMQMMVWGLLGGALNTDYPAQGECVGDYHNDGWLDLYVVNIGAQNGNYIENRLYHIKGTGSISLVSNAGEMTPGYHAIVWDGTNDLGSQVATGMYFYAIQTKEFQATKKMLFMK